MNDISLDINLYGKFEAKSVHFSAYSNCSIWDIKKLISKKTEFSPLQIQIMRQGKELAGPMTNACTLGDLAVTCMDKLSCSKVYIPVKVAPLVDAKGVFMPGVEKIFEAWFERFADEELDGNMVMGDKGFNVFMRETTGSIHLDITKINQSKRQFTGGDTEYVTKEQFIKFYREKSKEKPDVVRANLRAHHIGNDLKST